MAIKHKIGCLATCLTLLLGAGYVHGQQGTPPKDAEEKKVPSAEIPPPRLAPPTITDLSCPETTGTTPFLALTGKARIDDTQYQTLRIGCLELASNNTLLEDKHLLALEQAAQYIMDSPQFIRVYIDLEDAEIKEQELLKRFRTKAFAVRNYLTEKGVYDHLKANREGIFPSAFAKKDTKIEKVAPKTEKKKPIIAKKKPPIRKPSLDYTFQADTQQSFTSQVNPSLYSTPMKGKGFQFIPMQSIYFANDQDTLTNRAQATLLAMVHYILNHPGTNKLIIQSHADSTGPGPYNYKLTDRRAQAVRNFIVEKGVPENIVDIISRGEMDPIDESWTRQGKARNRRVELYIIQRNAQL